MHTGPVFLRRMQPDDWPAVSRIYAEGIAQGQATFETTVPDWHTWHGAHLAEDRYVAVADGRVIGWAALSPVSDRCAYASVAEVSVYVAEHVRGRGTGKLLLDHLIAQAEQHGIWTLQAGIFPENEASIGLHIKCGFRLVGRRERLGKLNGVWRDVLMYERRSKKTGV